MAAHFPSGRGVLACPKTELERNVLKWPGGTRGLRRGRELSRHGGERRLRRLPSRRRHREGGSIAGDASASLGFVSDNGGECAIEGSCGACGETTG